MNTAITARLPRIALAACISAFALPALAADDASRWSVKLGYNIITPQVSSGDLSAPSLAGSKTGVDAASAPLLTISYRWLPNLEAELMLGTGYRHTLQGAGALAGTGDLGTVDAYPPTVLLKYRFLDEGSKLRPFVGAGPTYAVFRNFRGSSALNGATGGSPANPTSIKTDAALGLTLATGASFEMGQGWFAEVMLMKTFLKTKATLSTGQTQTMRLDPVGFNLGIGYRF